MLEGSKKAMKMLQLWRDSVDKDDFTYSRLAAALEKNGFLRLAHNYCYSETGMKKYTNILSYSACSDGYDYNLFKVNEVGRNHILANCVKFLPQTLKTSEGYTYIARGAVHMASESLTIEERLIISLAYI